MQLTWARRQPPETGTNGRWWLLASIVLYASLGANLLVLVASSGSTNLAPTLTKLSFNVYGLLGLAFAIRAATHPNLDRRSHRALAVISVSFLLLLGSAVLRRFYPIGTAFPSPADLLRLLFGPVLLLGLLLLPTRRQSRRELQQVWLDTLVVVIAGGVLLWFLQIGPSVTNGTINGRALAAAFAYPAIDLMLIFGATVVLFRGAAESARQPAKILAAAAVALVVGDMLLGYRQSRGPSVGAPQWQFACWMIGHFLLMMAMFTQCRQAGGHRLHIEQPRARSISKLPYLAIGLSYALLLILARDLPLQIHGVVVGTAGVTMVVVARQILASRENHELAITDALTGLFNRRHLNNTLELALARGARSDQRTAVLLMDMNGFKQINDTMGHEAGDRLLIAFSQVLRRNVLGLDAVGRLGGDEFAVVLHNIGKLANAEAVADRIVADLQNPVLVGDTPVQPRASIGIALSEPGEHSADQILHLADLAMYRAKETTRKTGATSVAHHAPSHEPAGLRVASDK